MSAPAGFYQLLRRLRKEFPAGTGRKVSVRTVDKFKHHGCTWFYPSGKCKVVIRRDKYSMMFDTLIHEWAHVLQADSEPVSDDPVTQHSAVWGRIYSEIYRAMLKETPQD
jgi:hypothetical protein